MTEFIYVVKEIQDLTRYFWADKIDLNSVLNLKG